MKSTTIHAALPARNPEALGAVKQASARTGVDFRFLVANASSESRLSTQAKNPVSSATGLFQFTRSTWFAMVQKHGAEYGLGEAAAQVQRRADGTFTVADPTQRQAILDLRKDPTISASLAAEYARDNGNYLKKQLGREVGSTDLFAAHFFGPNGAVKFLKAADAGGAASAADVLPSAARSNHRVFYAADGRARSVSEVHAALARKVGAVQVAEAPTDDPPAPRALSTDNISAATTLLQAQEESTLG